jgi:hypothetical protein
MDTCMAICSWSNIRVSIVFEGVRLYGSVLCSLSACHTSSKTSFALLFWRWLWSRRTRHWWATFSTDGPQRWQDARMSVLRMTIVILTHDSHNQTMWNCSWKVCVETWFKRHLCRCDYWNYWDQTGTILLFVDATEVCCCEPFVTLPSQTLVLVHGFFSQICSRYWHFNRFTAIEGQGNLNCIRISQCILLDVAWCQFLWLCLLV